MAASSLAARLAAAAALEADRRDLPDAPPRVAAVCPAADAERVHLAASAHLEAEPDGRAHCPVRNWAELADFPAVLCRPGRACRMATRKATARRNKKAPDTTAPDIASRDRAHYSAGLAASGRRTKPAPGRRAHGSKNRAEADSPEASPQGSRPPRPERRRDAAGAARRDSGARRNPRPRARFPARAARRKAYLVPAPGRPQPVWRADRRAPPRRDCWRDGDPEKALPPPHQSRRAFRISRKHAGVAKRDRSRPGCIGRISPGATVGNRSQILRISINTNLSPGVLQLLRPLALPLSSQTKHRLRPRGTKPAHPFQLQKPAIGPLVHRNLRPIGLGVFVRSLRHRARESLLLQDRPRPAPSKWTGIRAR
ncbi:hypothetical protein A7A08_01371 [Methyloligella halotolerans]|uniref:Uncharacterized protein n=1 Tax=Methyloligella halotolerans TaxID=1177755 RepID=A0A1E2RZ13_9HYPH|nr:hypothetical protein A7A08_01371 [Methyloligella halotolerans]